MIKLFLCESFFQSVQSVMAMPKQKLRLRLALCHLQIKCGGRKWSIMLLFISH